MSSVAGTSSSIGRGPRKQHVKKTSKRTAGSQKRSPTRHRTKRPPARRPTKRAAAPHRTKRAPEEHALLAFAELATRLGLRWYVFGAQAVNLHGFPRATADLDITVELAGFKPAALIAKLADAGFSARFTDEAFIAATRVLPIVHDATHLPIDLVLAGPGLEQRFLDEVVAMPIGGKTVFVLSPENLIVTKLLAGRPKDLEDIRELLAIRSTTLDHARIESMLAELEAALDQSDLLPRYRALRDRG